jgi:hypothetical protein
MIQRMEFRVSEDKAQRTLGKDFGGTVLGDSVRVLMADMPSPLYSRIGDLEAQFRAEGSCFFTWWEPHRSYTAQELASATLLHIDLKHYFEPCGEDCGTTYDETAACPVCRAGAPQSSPLRLKRYPKSRDIASTIAGEIIVSRRIVDFFKKHHVTGARFGPVYLGRRSTSPVAERFQLFVDPTVDISPKTLTCSDPFDLDEGNEYRCPRGDTIGLRLLSELFLVRSSYDGRDIAATRQFTSYRVGVMRPYQHLVISQRLYRLLNEEKIRGFKTEIARLV